MKAKVNIPVFLQSLRTAKLGLAQKDIRPILVHFYLEFTDRNTILIKSTNGEIFVETSSPAEVSETGSCCIPGANFYKLLSVLESGSAELVKDGDVLKLNSSDALSEANVFEFPVRKSEEFPEFPDVGEFNTVPNAVIEGFRKVSFSVSKDQRKVAMTGVHLVSKDGKLMIEATDEYQINRFAVEDTEIEDNLDLLIPVEVVDAVSSLRPDSLQLASSETHVGFKIGNTTKLISTFLSAKFPNIDKLFTDFTTSTLGSLKVMREPLLEAVRRVLVMVEELDKSLDKGITLRFSDSTLSISSRAGHYAGKVNVKYEGEGPNFPVSVDPNILVKYLNNTHGEIVFQYAKADHPAVKLKQENQEFLVSVIVTPE